VIVLLATIALAIAERARRDPARWGARGTAVSLASGLALLATTIAAACSERTELVGLLPVALGIGLRAAAMRALGDAFTSETAFVPGRPIVETGLYRWTRHPSDLGLVLHAGGLAVLGGSALAGAFALVVAVTAVMRIADEERLRKHRPHRPRLASPRS
jgi:protein-S-isoprenylcysteine O-methyltransferase Ste14